jgi:DedD protein
MDQGLKERLVGAAVLVAIGVWLIPWVLDGPEAPLDTGASSLQLPVAEEPMPMRTQTLRLGEPEATTTTAAGEAQAEPLVTVAAPAEPPATDSAGAEPLAAAPAEETGAPTAQRDEPAPPSATAPAPAAETAPAPPRAAQGGPARPPRAAVAAAPTPKPAASAAAGEWIVQLGSFGEEANARRLAQRASTFGYKADVSSYRSNNRTLYRVRVGPATSRATADATASALKAHGIESRVVAAR